MLLFAKDITQRDHKHGNEEQDADLREYMEYQRKLFPYTVVRAGLDLAYKELDDILQYVDHDHQPPPDSSRKDYPADIPEWYRNRFPWSSAFLKMEDMHFTLVALVKAMDSFRTHERVNSYHFAVLYDAVHNIVPVYNHLLETAPDNARDIHLSNEIPVHFDDFINNYWPQLDFMILSKPDYAHARHMDRKRNIEEEIKKQMSEGVDPLTALGKISTAFGLDESTLAMLRREDVQTRYLEPESKIQSADQYDWLTKKNAEGSVIDAEYSRNFEYHRDSVISQGSPPS